jgi:hypothetical protein
MTNVLLFFITNAMVAVTATAYFINRFADHIG